MAKLGDFEAELAKLGEAATAARRVGAPDGPGARMIIDRLGGIVRDLKNRGLAA